VSVHRTVVVGTDGSPSSLRAALMELAAQAKADLVVVGNRGLDTLRGRLLGPVPADVTRRSHIDVLVVHTTG
jgi:nucleotide-binding universal stress UspA family protein